VTAVVTYVVQVWNGRRWSKVRSGEGGPWSTRDRAERQARSRERMPRRESSTEGYPHRVVEVAGATAGGARSERSS
jgi:hypothetical protein